MIKTERFYSLDVFRGATVAFMILVNNQMGSPYAPLDHAAWNGLTPTDLVFPFFLFAVGNAMSFTIPRLQNEGHKVFWKKTLSRTFVIFMTGFCLNWFPFVMWSDNHIVIKGWEWTNASGELSGVRIMGVLQRISLSFLAASIMVYYFKPRFLVICSFFLLTLYSVMCILYAQGNDAFSLPGYFGTPIDIAVFKPWHMYHGEGVAFDPEGLAGTFPAAVSVIIGYLAGKFILRKGRTYEMLSILLLSGVCVLFAGYISNLFFPVNKKIWSASFVLVSAGMGLLVLGIFIFELEIKSGTVKWSRIFDAFGKNSLFIFVLSGVVPRLANLIHIPYRMEAGRGLMTVSPFFWFYKNFCVQLCMGNEQMGSLCFSILLVSVYWVVAVIMDKNKIYIRV